MAMDKGINLLVRGGSYPKGFYACKLNCLHTCSCSMWCWAWTVRATEIETSVDFNRPSQNLWICVREMIKRHVICTWFPRHLAFSLLLRVAVASHHTVCTLILCVLPWNYALAAIFNTWGKVRRIIAPSKSCKCCFLCTVSNQFTEGFVCC